MYLSSISENTNSYDFCMIERHSFKKTGNEVHANLKQANKINFIKGKKILSVPGNTLKTKLRAKQIAAAQLNCNTLWEMASTLSHTPVCQQ